MDGKNVRLLFMYITYQEMELPDWSDKSQKNTY